MGAILSKIVPILLSPFIWLWPLKWARVRPGSAAVRFRSGKPGPNLTKPGVYWATARQVFVCRHVSRPDPLSSDTIRALTADGVPVQAEAIITYTITDLAAFLTESEDALAYTSSVVEAFVLNAIQSSTFTRLLRGLGTTEKEIQRALNAEVRPLGLRVLKVRFQNLEHVDPLARAMFSAKVGAVALAEAAEELRNGQEKQLPFREAVVALSPAIAYTWPVGQETLRAEEATKPKPEEVANEI